MRLILALMSVCFFATCSAVVIENKNGIIKVDKWGSKIKTCKNGRKPNRNEVVPTWLPNN